MAITLPCSYSGQALTLLGDKGRFVVPADFRKTLKESSAGRVLCLAKHDRWDCLVGFGLSRESELEEQLDREEEKHIRLGRDYDRELRANQLFGYEKIPFDDSGRFIMPDHIRAQAAIDQALYFRGAGRFFTIWNPDQLNRMSEDWASAKAGCAGLLADNASKSGKNAAGAGKSARKS